MPCRCLCGHTDTGPSPYQPSLSPLIKNGEKATCPTISAPSTATSEIVRSPSSRNPAMIEASEPSLNGMGLNAATVRSSIICSSPSCSSRMKIVMAEGTPSLRFHYAAQKDGIATRQSSTEPPFVGMSRHGSFPPVTDTRLPPLACCLEPDAPSPRNVSTRPSFAYAALMRMSGVSARLQMLWLIRRPGGGRSAFRYSRRPSFRNPRRWPCRAVSRPSCRR